MSGPGVAPGEPAVATAATPAARAAVAGLLADREATYLAEYEALVEATFAVAARTGSAEPKVAEIVAESGLSNQAFYRHFRSKDELMLAVLEDGRHRLVDHLGRRMARASTPLGGVEAWVRGVLAQARDTDAAARSRPFAVHGDRLAARYPDAQGESVHRLMALLADAVGGAVDAGQLPDEAAQRVDLVFWSTFDRLGRDLVVDSAPADDEVDRFVAFCLAGFGGASTASPR